MLINQNTLSAETLALVKGLLSPTLAKAGWTQPGSAVSGINYYDLEPRAKMLFPILTPFRNRISRSSGVGGIQANWRAVTGINTGHQSPGVAEGLRNGAMTHSTADYFAAYRTMGQDDFVTEEAIAAANGFDNARALTVDNLLRAAMISEEIVILGGDTSLGIAAGAAAPTPTLTASNTGGALTAAASPYSVICVPLTLEGYQQVAGVNLGTTGEQVNIATAVLTPVITRTNMGAGGGTTVYGGGVFRKSAAASVSIGSGTTGSIVAVEADVPGAFAYAWFWGAAGAETLGAVTTLNTVLITADATGTFLAATLPAVEHATNAYEYDGLLTMLSKGLGNYYKVLAAGTTGAGTKLTTDGAGGITEVNDMFNFHYNLYRLSIDTLYCNFQQMLDMNKLVIASGGAPLYRFNMDATGDTTVVGGQVLGFLLNKITGRKVRVETHPAMPPGVMIGYSESIPYPMSGIRELLTIRCRYDYRSYDWPMVQRQYEYGVYWDSVLQNYFFPAFGVIKNIAPGT